MAFTSSTQLLQYSSIRTSFRLRTRIFSSSSQPQTGIRANPRPVIAANLDAKEDIVIVGAGIAGLATAVSLHRLGIRTRVLEQAESLRTGGTSLSLSKNGWKVLDAIGVGNSVRPHFLEIQGVAMKSEDGRLLRSFSLKEEDPSQELRAVERKVLLESLMNALPSDTISFSSGLSKIERHESGDTLLELEDGSRLSAKIVIACDGIRSPVAKWMGFPEPTYAGHLCFRGLGSYPEGQSFDQKVQYTYGRGVRAGFIPISKTKIYWFIIFNSSSPGPKITDPLILRQQAQELVRSWSPELLNIINHTPDETLIRTPLVDRWLWPATSPPASTGRVVLVGDAWHPMTPNLGQGACCALEDSIVLAKKLAEAIKSKNVSVEEAFREYERERWPRIFPLTIRAHLVGAFLQWDNPVVCSIRNNVIVPKLVRLGPMLQHTNFECEPL
nr:FAD-dependent urate hydroxylase-like [Ipomoea batatas]